jgi:protocatechuate 3,4-dioxygenase beta subunit
MQRRYLVLFIPVVAALAQAPADQKPATVEGTVVNSVTGAPLRKVDLALSNGEMSQEMAAMMRQFGSGASAPLPQVTTKTFAASTDGNGKFHFEQVPPGTYWLTAQKPGFADGRYPPKEGSLRLSSGQEMSHVDMRLVPYGTLSGHVLDEDGEPFPAAMVTALSYSFVSGRRRLMPADSAQSNNKGEFSLGKIPPGHYFLSANAMRMGFAAKATPAPPADGAPETAYVSTYLPNALDAADAQRIDVAAGAELTGFNIQLRKSLVVRVKGRLTDANGDPIKSAQIMLMGGAGGIGSMSMTMVGDPQGKFEIANVQPGAYTAMTVQMQGTSPKMSMQPLIVPDRNVENLELGAGPEATIQGKVVVDGDAKLLPDGFPVTLMAAAGMAVMPVFGKADKSGAFTLEHVTRASYELTLPLSPEGTYVKSVMFNDRESLGQELDCTAMATGTLRLVLGTDGGKVEARVSRDDKPAPNATVVLLPSEPNRRHPQMVRTGSSDEGGHITLKDVPPGDYLAFAWEEVEDGIWFDPDFVKAQTEAVRVRIGPKATEQVDLNLIPASK